MLIHTNKTKSKSIIDNFFIHNLRIRAYVQVITKSWQSDLIIGQVDYQSWQLLRKNLASSRFQDALRKTGSVLCIKLDGNASKNTLLHIMSLVNIVDLIQDAVSTLFGSPQQINNRRRSGAHGCKSGCTSALGFTSKTSASSRRRAPWRQRNR